MPEIIDHPTISVPGKGTYTVRFGLGAQYTLEKEHHVSMEEVGQRLQQAAPRTIDGMLVPGRISPSFLFDVLSACIWGQIQISPRELADCYEYLEDIQEVARVVMVAFTKTQWSRQKTAPAAATATEGPPQPVQ